MSHIVLNSYRIMWLIVFFDLPVQTKIQRKQAARFRKSLETFGFTMLQYSVYMRHCPSKESLAAQVKRIKLTVPPAGKISILKITDKQYSDIINYSGKMRELLPETPRQLELF